MRDAGPDGGNRVLERVREAIGADGAAGGVLGGDGIGGVAVGCCAEGKACERMGGLNGR